jgi:hypothetical protein
MGVARAVDYSDALLGLSPQLSKIILATQW